jgi:hypothetical protein
LAQFLRAVELNKDFAPGLFNIGAMALAYRDYEGAERVLGRVIELDPTSYESFLAYAWALDGQKGRDPKKGLKAGETFERVLAIKPDQPDAICGAAWAYAADKSGWDKALKFFEICRGLKSTTAQEQQLIDNKVKGIVAMQKQPATAPQPKPEDKLKPAAPPASGPSLLDKVTDEASRDSEAQPSEGASSAAPPEPKASTPSAP